MVDGGNIRQNRVAHLFGPDGKKIEPILDREIPDVPAYNEKDLESVKIVLHALIRHVEDYESLTIKMPYRTKKGTEAGIFRPVFLALRMFKTLEARDKKIAKLERQIQELKKRVADR